MEQDIVRDIRVVAERLRLKPGEEFGLPEYLESGGRFSSYQISDGGYRWSDYCTKAGFRPKVKDPASDEEYYERYVKAVKALGRFPKESERKRFGLKMSAHRREILNKFRRRALSEGILELPDLQLLISSLNSA